MKKRSGKGSSGSCDFPPVLFQLWLDDRLPDRAFIAHLLVHLSSLCSSCQQAFLKAAQPRTPGGEWLRELHRKGAAEGLTVQEAIEKAVARVHEAKAEVYRPGASEDGQALFEAFLDLPASERPRWVEAQPAEVAALVLGRRILALSRERAAADPEESITLARLAARCGAKIFPLRIHGLLAKDLRALAAAVEGNGYRLLGDYPMAIACFCDADGLVVGGTGDPVTFAEVHSYRASLLRDQSRLPEAAAYARRAAVVFKKVGEHHLAGRAYLKLSVIQHTMDDHGKAVAAAWDALSLLDPEQDPQTVQFAYENLALYVSEAGDPARAREILAEHPSPEGCPEHFRLMRTWHEYLIAAKLGEQAEAIAGLEEVRDAFAALGDAPNAATATLDLALLHGEAGDAAAMGRTAAEALPLLVPLGLPDEVLGTLMMLQEAARAEALTVGLLRKAQKELNRPAAWRKV